MGEDEIRSLLYGTEGATLDFKQEQYRFVKASDDDKSELLKDILGFANAWRSSPGYILIGSVEGSGGRPAEVVGIPEVEQLQDHSLQEFVSAKTNRPVRFRYRACQFEGKQVGVIELEANQPRPVYLQKDFGKLRKGMVYVRRGSSTNPDRPADAAEVEQMLRHSLGASADIAVTFCEIDREVDLGNGVTFASERCQMPPDDSIPLLADQGSQFGLDAAWSLTKRPNRRLWREAAHFEFMQRIFRPVRLCVKNTGKSNAESVRIEIQIPVPEGIRAINDLEMPERPERTRSILAKPETEITRPIINRPGSVFVDRGKEHCRVEIECGTLQPGRSIRTDTFYVASAESANVDVAGQIFAASLTSPFPFTLRFVFEVKQTSMTLTELRTIANKY
ncbi:helix-turn-helix domain-containing protein [Planctomyces sp. SH-PL14]|uniref:AlbA family DNA-binding domain-containing protein n=1 Tax=Planctomyces sp. SH-PL14 TaxID=1632864 RepID=UPI00078E0089|nr:ATP-binding protein [Planctomyces sp. SH-PL14]AMV18212.1 Divergent AAA domain protein [Planctomyces sp. SH-PL14]